MPPQDLNAFFAAKKKKVKTVNLNKAATSIEEQLEKEKEKKEKEEKEKEDGTWANEEVNVPQVDASTIKIAGNLEVQENANAKKVQQKTWGNAKQHSISNMEGYERQNKERQFPEMGTGMQKTGVQIGQLDKKAKVDAKTNQFAGLVNDDDDDDEEKAGYIVHSAHLGKKKGENAAQAFKSELVTNHGLKNSSANDNNSKELSKEEKKLAEEKARKKAEKEAEKQKLKEQKDAEKLAAKQKVTFSEELCKTMEFFQYGVFSSELCAKKYEERVRRPEIELAY